MQKTLGRPKTKPEGLKTINIELPAGLFELLRVKAAKAGFKALKPYVESLVLDGHKKAK